jgi:hypothetical protein
LSEIDLHAQLVDRIARSIEVDGRGEYLILIDSRAGLARLTPPALENVRPDIFARHTQTRYAVIGEAKTLSDVENPHTEHQLECYFRHLALEGGGEVRLAVPWKRLDRMIFMVRRARRIAGASVIRYSVSGWALPDSDFCEQRHG